jgi:hypothetical protein
LPNVDNFGEDLSGCRRLFNTGPSLESRSSRTLILEEWKAEGSQRLRAWRVSEFSPFHLKTSKRVRFKSAAALRPGRPSHRDVLARSAPQSQAEIEFEYKLSTAKYELRIAQVVYLARTWVVLGKF